MNNEYSLADVGLHASILYYLKARFHFNKDQFADLMVISGIAGTISQMLLMPILAPAIGEDRLLSIGLFFASAHMFLYSVAWSFWVPYVAAMFSIFFVFSQPCIRSIVSRQVGSCEQVFVVDQTLFWQHTGIGFFNIISVSVRQYSVIFIFPWFNKMVLKTYQVQIMFNTVENVKHTCKKVEGDRNWEKKSFIWGC
ncbi:hypothetical protein SLA2020_202520 [Shorea laevis]